MDEDVPASEAYEHSELLLYKARILEEGGRGITSDTVKLMCATCTLANSDQSTVPPGSVCVVGWTWHPYACWSPGGVVSAG